MAECVGKKLLILLCLCVVVLCLALVCSDNVAVSTAAARHRPWCMKNRSSESAGAVQARNGSRPPAVMHYTFPLDDSFGLPFEGTFNPSELHSAPWMTQLKNFILNLQSPSDPVILVAIDASYKSALVNWLIATQLNLDIPLENVLIITYDDHLCPFLESKNFNNCLSVPLSTILQEPTSLSHKPKMTPLLVARISVMRILNRWGFDVANFDSDAMILRNPVPLFRRYPTADVIGSCGGSYPLTLWRRWGVVICMGAILVRSSPSTGEDIIIKAI